MQRNEREDIFTNNVFLYHNLYLEDIPYLIIWIANVRILNLYGIQHTWNK